MSFSSDGAKLFDDIEKVEGQKSTRQLRNQSYCWHRALPLHTTLTLKVSVSVWLIVILKIQLLDHHLLHLQQIPRKMQYNFKSSDKDNLPIQIAALKVMHLCMPYFCTGTNVLALPSQLKTLWEKQHTCCKEKKRNTRPHSLSPSWVGAVMWGLYNRSY